MQQNTISLCEADPTTFWPWFTWTDFVGLSNKDKILVIVPVIGFADWGLDAPLDAEESVSMPVLRAASVKVSGRVRLLVVPPLRFVAGPSKTCAFAVDSPVAIELIENVARSIMGAGFQKLVLYNSSPWNEELVDATARDLRIDLGLQMFCVNLSALGLDFHPKRGRERSALSTILRAGDSANSAQEAAMVIDSAGEHLAALLGEIHHRPALPNGGCLVTMPVP